MERNSANMKAVAELERDFLEQLAALCPDGIIAVDRKGRIVLFNHTAEGLTGRRAEDVLGKSSITEIYATPETARAVKKAIYAEASGGSGRLEGYEVDVRSVDGNTIPIRLSATLIYKNGQEIGSVGFFHNLSGRKHLEEKLRLLSITDGLTGLYNHRHFHASLSRELERTRRYQRPLSLICFDLDRFKRCNDIWGHLEGDNVLRLVGELLGEIIRRTDQAFRYGGDEFFVLLPETPLNQAETTAEKIRQAFNDRWPYDEIGDNGQALRATLSMGVTQAHPDDTAEGLIKRADLAMYEAKNSGGDKVVAAANRTEN